MSSKKTPKKKDKKSPKKKFQVKAPKLPSFSDEELNEEVDIFLTVQNPYESENCVEYDKKTQIFKHIFDYKKPVTFYRTIGAVKRRLVGSYGIVYEEVEKTEEDKMKNKFNFRSVAVQTDLCEPKDKNDYIDPTLYPVLKFEGTASKAEILAAYKKNEAIREENENGWIEFDLRHLLKHTGRKELPLIENDRNYLRLCERMIDQNKSEANLDFSFYDDPNDEFKPNSGSLLPLWILSVKDTKGMSVTSFSWNTLYSDLFAVGFGKTKLDDEEDEDEDDLGLMREKGCVCVFSLKGPSHPQKIFQCSSGVCCVEFHPTLPQLLAVAFSGGGIAVYDLRKEDTSPRGKDSKFMQCHHQDKVSKVQWLPDRIPQKMCSVSYDGKIINWLFLLNDLFPAEIVTSLSLKDWPLDAPPKGLEMVIETKKDVGETLELNTCGTALSINPHNTELFLIGTETGFIHKYSFDDKICLTSYKEHKGYVCDVHWNHLHPRVFISCSTDFTVQIWDQASTHTVFEFFFESEVVDVAWASFSSTLFAAISGNAVVSVFDLAVNKQDAIGTFTVYTPKQEIRLTRIVFHPVKPVLLVGDDRGCIVIFKLSPNLRSALKAVGTMEYSKFLAGEIEKLDKLLASAKVSEKLRPKSHAVGGAS